MTSEEIKRADVLPPKQWRFENGVYKCDGDCDSWSWGICTCGLISHLEWSQATGRADAKLWSRVPQLRWDVVREWLLNNEEFRKVASVTDCCHGIHIDKECATCKEDGERFMREFFKDHDGAEPT